MWLAFAHKDNSTDLSQGEGYSISYKHIVEDSEVYWTIQSLEKVIFMCQSVSDTDNWNI